MKFLYFGDLHERPTSPENRMDNYRETLNKKIEEIQQIGRKHKVKAFLQPGDFLNHPKYDSNFLSEVVNRWGFSNIQEEMLDIATGKVNPQDLANKVKDYIPLIGTIGNHELHGNSLKSYPETSLYFLEQIGFMHIPTRDKPFIFTDESGYTVAITATPYHINMDNPDYINDYIVEEKMGDFHIHIVHGFLTSKDMGNLFPHTTVDDIAKKTKADLTIAGHDHIGFPLMEVDGKLFVNPGAVIRTKNDVKEIKRRPKVLLIDITKEKGLSVRNIYLKSAQKGEEVLDRSHKVFQQSMSSKLEKIKSLVNKSNVGTGLSITDIIQAISKSERIDDDLKDRAIKAVTDKMNSIQSHSKPVQDYYIEKIILENFQSHKYSEYELNNGLNVFTGKSSSGKSAIQRALAWVYENEGRNPRRFIKNGEAYAKVSLYLSNGFIISRLVEKKRNGKNGYEVFNPNDGETTYYNTRSLPLIQEYLSFNYLQIDEKSNVPLNFQKQGASWFFIGDGFTNTDRAKIIGAVYQTHYVDAVIKDLESESKRMSTRIKDRNKELQSLDEEIEKYDHLPQLEKTIQDIEKRLEELQKKQEIVEKAKAIVEERKQIEKQIQLDQALIQSLGHLTLAEQKLDELMKKNEIKRKVTQLKDNLDEIMREHQKEKQILLSLKDIQKAEDQFNQLMDKAQTYQKLKEKAEKAIHLEKQLKDTEQNIEKCKQIIEMYKHVDVAESKLQQLENKIKIVEQSKVITERLNEITKSGVKERQYIHTLNQENQQLVLHYQKLLEEVGTCPVCQSEIDQKTIQQISSNYLMDEEERMRKNVS